MVMLRGVCSRARSRRVPNRFAIASRSSSLTEVSRVWANRSNSSRVLSSRRSVIIAIINSVIR